MFILDTNVVSELRKVSAGRADPHVVRWAEGVDAENLYISAVTVLELELGIRQVERRDTAQGGRLRTWLHNHVLFSFEGRILPIDTIVALRCASLHVPNRQPERDALIAATALVHNMTVVTRNLADFKATGVRLMNPWEA